jgi:hypothetical protein
VFRPVFGRFTGAEVASLRESRRADYERLPEGRTAIFSRLILEAEKPTCSCPGFTEIPGFP